MRGCSCRGTAGFAHVSCLAEQAKILFAEAEENNLDYKVFDERWVRWDKCSLCEQQYHGFVRCALGWACWKTYVGRPETDRARHMAMGLLGSGLHVARYFEDSLSVREADLSLQRRLGASEYELLVVQGNLAGTYHELGRFEEANRMLRDVYSGFLKLHGEEHRETLLTASNYVDSLRTLSRFGEAKSLLRKTLPVARRVLGEDNDGTLMMRLNYAQSLCQDDDATLDDIREAVAICEDVDRRARRVLGIAHPLAKDASGSLERARYDLANFKPK